MSIPRRLPDEPDPEQKQPAEPPAGAAGMVPMPKQFGYHVHDMAVGPCACGAWHKITDWPPEIQSALSTTPPPQPPEATPETDAQAFRYKRNAAGDVYRDRTFTGDLVESDFARTLEHQRNEARGQRDDLQAHYEEMKQTCDLLIVHRDEARAALADAQAEVEAAREAYTSTQQSTLARLNAIARAFGWQPQTKNEDPELDDLRAELEQTRRDRDNWKSSAEVRAHERKIACERLTAAEQRADGAEKERDESRRKATALNGVINQMANAFNAQDADRFWKAEGRAAKLVEEWTPDLAEATAQRDTAIRERDEAKAEVEELKEAREATAGRHGGEILRLNTNHSHRIAALGAALDAFERTERGIPQAHMAAKLVAELRAALAAKTPEGGV